MIEITGGDFLAGGGGVTHAMTNNGIEMKWVLNHDKIAIRTNMHNNKGIMHYLADFYNQDEHDMPKVDFIWASIECTQFSRAKGGKQKDIKSYMLGWEMVRYIQHLQPLAIGIENVPEFKDWAPVRVKEMKKKSTKKYSALKIDKDGSLLYEPNKEHKGKMFVKWVEAIKALGYHYHESIRNAADDGLRTRRVRYFAYFTKSHLKMDVRWPAPTHSKNGENGLPKWLSCAPLIDLTNEGQSIFGREVNPNIKPQYRKPHCVNTLKRIAGGIKKFAPELAFIFQYYGSGLNVQSLKSPLNTITTKDRHVLVTLEKNQFIADYYGRDNTAHSLNGPANTIRSCNSKHLVTSEIKFIADHCHTDNYQTTNEPLAPQLTRQTKQFISLQYNSNGNPDANNHSINSPLASVTTRQKQQFISVYFNSGGNPKSQNQSIENPLGTITTGTNKKALVTALENGQLDFDIKMRFLTPTELAAISSFPDGYFSDPLLKLSIKEQTALIGKAVPPQWAEKLIKPVVDELRSILEQKQAI